MIVALYIKRNFITQQHRAWSFAAADFLIVFTFCKVLIDDVGVDHRRPNPTSLFAAVHFFTIGFTIRPSTIKTFVTNKLSRSGNRVRQTNT